MSPSKVAEVFHELFEFYQEPIREIDLLEERLLLESVAVFYLKSLQFLIKQKQYAAAKDLKDIYLRLQALAKNRITTSNGQHKIDP